MNINLLTITLFIKHVVLYSCCKQTEHITQYERARLELSPVYCTLHLPKDEHRHHSVCSTWEAFFFYFHKSLTVLVLKDTWMLTQ